MQAGCLQLMPWLGSGLPAHPAFGSCDPSRGDNLDMLGSHACVSMAQHHSSEPCFASTRRPRFSRKAKRGGINNSADQIPGPPWCKFNLCERKEWIMDKTGRGLRRFGPAPVSSVSTVLIVPYRSSTWRRSTLDECRFQLQQRPHRLETRHDFFISSPLERGCAPGSRRVWSTLLYGMVRLGQAWDAPILAWILQRARGDRTSQPPTPQS